MLCGESPPRRSYRGIGTRFGFLLFGVDVLIGFVRECGSSKGFKPCVL